VINHFALVRTWERVDLGTRGTEVVRSIEYWIALWSHGRSPATGLIAVY